MIRLLPAILSFVLVLAATAVRADDGMPEHTTDTSRWDCMFCPYEFGWYGEIDVGAGWVSDASNKFGDYRGLADDGGFAAIDGEGHYRDQGGHFFDIRAADLGIDSRRVEAQGGKRGRYTVEFAYREIPKYRGFGTESPFLGIGGNELTLPANWQTAPLTSGLSSLSSSLQPIELKTTRKILDAALSWKFDRRWSYEMHYQHQAKEGTRPFGGGRFTNNTSHLPAPVDFSTDRLSMGLNFNGKRSHWRFGFSGSAFDNGLESVTWQNPFTPSPGTELFRSSLEPDNSFYQFDLAGAWTPHSRIRLSGAAAIGRMEQDDPLLPYSINPEFSDLPLPRMTADTRIDVGTVDLSGKLTARLARRLDLTARVSREERDNKTPIDIWTPVITDFIERDPRPNRPYSFERDRASVSLRYRPASKWRFQAGADWDNNERTLQSVMETEESGWFAEAAFSAGSKVELRARLEQSDRDGRPYIQVPDFSLPEHPLMRKFNLADRGRERIRLDVDFFPAPEWLLNVAWRSGEDEYEASVIGLRESEERSLSMDLSWTPGETITAYAFFSHDEFDSLQAGAEEAIATPWLATTNDTFLTAGIGLTARLGNRTELGFDYVSSRADGDIRTDTGAGEPPFPTLVTDLQNARLRLEYRAGEHWGIRFYVEHEKYDSADWALDGLPPDGIPAVLSFGAESPDYDITLLRVQASYRF